MTTIYTSTVWCSCYALECLHILCNSTCVHYMIVISHTVYMCTNCVSLFILVCVLELCVFFPSLSLSVSLSLSLPPLSPSFSLSFKSECVCVCFYYYYVMVCVSEHCFKGCSYSFDCILSFDVISCFDHFLSLLASLSLGGGGGGGR